MEIQKVWELNGTIYAIASTDDTKHSKIVILEEVTDIAGRPYWQPVRAELTQIRILAETLTSGIAANELPLDEYGDGQGFSLAS